MTPRRTSVEHTKGVFNVEWPLFGELSRALALKVSRAYDPEIVVGVATAGVIPGAVIAAILDRCATRCPRRCGHGTISRAQPTRAHRRRDVRQRRYASPRRKCGQWRW